MTSKINNIIAWSNKKIIDTLETYHSAIGFIKYAMLYTKSIVYLVMSLAKGYNSDPGVDHWKAVKIILKNLKRTK